MKKEKIMKTVIFIVVLLIPIIYSFFYLKSYWNPYGDLSDIKIAIVNLDKGEDGENQGKEFVSELKEDGTFQICEVKDKEANTGMDKGEYYAKITIPENFTEYLNSASTENKRIAEITYSPNQASNYLATQIIGSAMKTVETSLQAKVNSKIVANLSEKLQEVPDSLQTIADGSKEILDGSESLKSGIDKINKGTNKLSDSYTKFDDGVNSAYKGSKQISNGVSKAEEGVKTLSDGSKLLDSSMETINEGVNELSKKGEEGITSLGNGITDLNNGATDLNAGVSEYVDGTNQVITYLNGVESVNEKEENILKAIKDTSKNTSLTSEQKLAIINGALSKYDLITSSKDYKKLQASKPLISVAKSKLSVKGTDLKAGAKELNDGTNKLALGAKDLTKITSGITNLKAGLQKVGQGTKSLNTGVSTLLTGTKTLKSGTTDLSNGLKTLDKNSKVIETSLNTLSDGTKSAYEGSKKLSDGAKTFNEEINNGIKDTKEELKTLDGLDKFSEDPVEFKTEANGKVDSYGIAFTPLFLCIGLWVGALMCYVVLYYDQKNRYKYLDSAAKNKLLQNLFYIVIGAVQGIVTALLLKLGLGFELQNAALYYCASILIGITFISIIQFLIRNLGDIGKFLALIILVLQLAASGGTFPIETINKGFRALTPYLPMTYSIKLLREILVPTTANFKAQYILILLAITVCTVTITYVVDIVRNKKETVKE